MGFFFPEAPRWSLFDELTLFPKRFAKIAMKISNIVAFELYSLYTREQLTRKTSYTFRLLMSTSVIILSVYSYPFPLLNIFNIIHTYKQWRRNITKRHFNRFLPLEYRTLLHNIYILILNLCVTEAFMYLIIGNLPVTQDCETLPCLLILNF